MSKQIFVKGKAFIKQTIRLITIPDFFAGIIQSKTIKAREKIGVISKLMFKG